MKLRKHFLPLVFVFISAGLLMAACTPGSLVGTATPVQSSQETSPATPTSTLAPTEMDTPTAPQPPAVLLAQQELARLQNITVDQVKIVSVEAVEWPDACLGVQKPDEMCAQVVTPGYQIVLEASGDSYELHTNDDGSVIRLVEDSGQAGLPAETLSTAALPAPAGNLLMWEHTENEVCSRVEIEGQVVFYGQCAGTLQETELSASRAEELAYLTATYQPFTADTEAGRVAFNGLGALEPTDAEKRSVGEWARLVHMEAQGGRSGAAWGLAFSWHREGGIAGFCNDMGVSLTGWAMPSSCKVGQAQTAKAYRLSADELAQMYTWIDQFEGFDYEQKDAATADAMLVKVAFQGRGTEQATPTQQEEIAGFAALIYANAMTQ